MAWCAFRGRRVRLERKTLINGFDRRTKRDMKRLLFALSLSLLLPLKCFAACYADGSDTSDCEDIAAMAGRWYLKAAVGRSSCHIRTSGILAKLMIGNEDFFGSKKIIPQQDKSGFHFDNGYGGAQEYSLLGHGFAPCGIGNLVCDRNNSFDFKFHSGQRKIKGRIHSQLLYGSPEVGIGAYVCSIQYKAEMQRKPFPGQRK
jgi:hypothetical protein